MQSCSRAALVAISSGWLRSNEGSAAVLPFQTSTGTDVSKVQP